MLPTRTHFIFKNTHRQKVKGQKKMFYANENLKRAGLVMIMPDKIDFKTI